uniref:Uncharacterized protein n=1 Tax=Triticum urartu TaxID=4572 RepID=A0A8R7Q3B6_TRIUA
MIPYHIINFRNLISAVVDFRTDRWHCCFKGHSGVTMHLLCLDDGQRA